MIAVVRNLARRIAHTGGGYRLVRFLGQPPVGEVDWSMLWRTVPISSCFGQNRGQPIDRVYIEEFLGTHASRIQGRVLEVAEDTYTSQFGGAGVTARDVLHVVPGNPKATIVADLTDANNIPSASFDCIIITQTLQMIFDVQAAVHTLRRITRPGGCVLATMSGISQISQYDMEQWGEYWRFTTASARRLFTDAFPGGEVKVQSYGNVLTAIAFLHGLANVDLKAGELAVHDPQFELLIGVCATAPLCHSL